MRLFTALAIALLLSVACQETPEVQQPENPSKISNAPPSAIDTSLDEAIIPEAIIPEETEVGLPDETAETSVEEDRSKLVKHTEEADEKASKRRKKKLPKIKFDEQVFAFGKVNQGEKVEHQFTFKNTGRSALVIKQAKASCGCTQPSYPFIPIEPGEEGYIGVVFNSAGRLGQQQAIITIETNASPTTYKLKLEGFVADGKEEEPEG